MFTGVYTYKCLTSSLLLFKTYFFIVYHSYHVTCYLLDLCFLFFNVVCFEINWLINWLIVLSSTAPKWLSEPFSEAHQNKHVNCHILSCSTYHGNRNIRPLINDIDCELRLVELTSSVEFWAPQCCTATAGVQWLNVASDHRTRSRVFPGFTGSS